MSLALAKKCLINSVLVSVGAPIAYGVHKLSTSGEEDNNGSPLSLNSQFSSKYKAKSYGNKFGNYLKDASNNSDLLFWKKQLKQGDKPKIPLGSFFSNISTPCQLRKKCSDFYTQKIDQNPENALDKLDLWSFCSDLGAKPSLISIPRDSNGATCKGKLKCEENLFLVETKANNVFWEIRDKEFRKKGGLKLNITKDNSYKWFENQKKSSPKTKIRELCQMAYEMDTPTSSSETAPSKEEVRDYCSMSEYFD